MSVEAVARSRRAVLMGALGAAAATVATAIGRPAPVRAGVDGDVVLGAQNEHSQTTVITVATNSSVAFHGKGTGTGAEGIRGEGTAFGVHGVGTTGIGTLGTSGSSDGVKGESTNGNGVFGRANAAGRAGVLGRGNDVGVYGEVGSDNTSGSPSIDNTGVAGVNMTQGGTPMGLYGQAQWGIGVFGGSTNGIGMSGVADENAIRGQSTHSVPTSDFGTPSHNTGVLGVAGDIGAIPANTDETGVFGFCSLSPISTGVWGDSGQGYGVFGSGDVGVGGSGFIGVEATPVGAGSMGLFTRATTGEAGVYAYAGTGTPPAPIPNVAVQARAGSTSQVALNVNGKAQFSRSGRTTISTGASKKVVTMAGVTTASYIIATLQTNRAGTYVQSVVPAAGSFTINLNKTVPGATVVGFLVIN